MSELKEVCLPGNINIINNRTFARCGSLKQISIPASVEFIYGEAFTECNSLERVYVNRVEPPFLFPSAFSNYDVTLIVPDESLDKYSTADTWCNFTKIQPLSSASNDKCETPTISYVNGSLFFSCSTEGVEFVSEITDNDIKKYNDAIVPLTATYNISVYATKTGYENSEVVYATLCWIDAEPKTEV